MKNLISIILFIQFYTSIASADNKFMDKKNLSYTTARIEVLPLLRLSPQVDVSKDNLIFIHLPKVGGTNVVYVIDAIKNIHDHRFAVPRIEGISPNLITQGWIGGLASLKEQCTNHNYNVKCSKYNFISGHFPYGVHNYLNNKYKYITLIRHPIEREVSSVNFDYQRGYIKNQEDAIQTLLNVMIDNPQTRLIAGESYMSGECNEQILEMAKKNLKLDFLLVGVIEDVDTFIQALISILGKEPIAIGRSQVTYDKVITKLSEDLHSVLLHKHKYDLELYKYAKENWEKWKREHILGNFSIQKEQKILAIMPNFANTHKATYMTVAQIQRYNTLYSENKIIRIKQQHHGLDKQKEK